MRLSGFLHAFPDVRARMVAALLACCAVVALAGCSTTVGQQSTPTPVRTPTVAATPTPPAPPKVSISGGLVARRGHLEAATALVNSAWRASH